MSEETTQVKISMPLIDDKELQIIDTFYNDIVSEYTKAFVKEKDQIIIQRLMTTLQQENNQLKEELQKADSITQFCIFEGKEESTINFRECLNTLDLYKEVIEEVREYIKDSCYYPELENYSNMTSEEVKELLQILDKGVKNVQGSMETS